MKANQEWFTVSELAGMPGMPGSTRAVLKKVNKQMYASRKRAYGKGLEYALSSLPAMTQAYLKDVASADEKARGFKKKEAAAPGCCAQAASNKVADEIMAMSEMELFKAWLTVRKSVALGRMNVTTGDEFAMHCATFALFSEAAHVVSVFEREARG